MFVFICVHFLGRCGGEAGAWLPFLAPGLSCAHIHLVIRHYFIKTATFLCILFLRKVFGVFGHINHLIWTSFSFWVWISFLSIFTHLIKRTLLRAESGLVVPFYYDIFGSYLTTVFFWLVNLCLSPKFIVTLRDNYLVTLYVGAPINIGRSFREGQWCRYFFFPGFHGTKKPWPSRWAQNNSHFTACRQLVELLV